VTVETSTRRQDIIRIAAVEFARRGYRATTMRQIADAAGILPGSLYHHFESKEHVLREVMLGSTADYVVELERIAGQHKPAATLVRMALESRLELYREQGFALGVVLQTDKTTLQHEIFHEMRDLGLRIERAWDAILEKGVRDGDFAPDLDVRAVTFAIQGMVNWAHRWFNPDGRLSPRDLADQWSRLLLCGLEVRADRAARPPLSKRAKPVTTRSSGIKTAPSQTGRPRAKASGATTSRPRKS
jgi:AcrR family transcriptional regulator